MISKKFIVDINDKVFYIFGNKKHGIVVKAFIREISVNEYGVYYRTTNAKIIAIKTKDKKVNEALKIGQSVVAWAFNEEAFNKIWFIDKAKLKEVLGNG